MGKSADRDYEPGPVRASYSRLGPPVSAGGPQRSGYRARVLDRQDVEAAAEFGPEDNVRIGTERHGGSKARG